MKNKWLISALIALLAIGVTGSVLFLGRATQKEASAPALKSANTPLLATVYKSPFCGCCEGYIDAMRKEGYDARGINVDDLDAIKAKYGVPDDMASCHTIEIDGYFIEGHVPFAAVTKLLSERPDIDGIAAPGMPGGTPGMPGEKVSPLLIYQVKNGQYSEFMRIW